MDLLIKDVMRIIESHAPLSYKEGYDNIGLMVGDELAEVTGILFSMDTTLSVIDEALEKGANLIISHHPIFFMKPDRITQSTLQGRKVSKLLLNSLNVYAAHTNLDSVKNGMNDTIVKMLGFKDVDILDQCEFDYESGIGRIVHVRDPLTVGELLHRVEEVLGATSIRYTGSTKKQIHRLAVINGSGQDYFEMARAAGADCILTGDTTYHGVQDMHEIGISVVDPGHFSTEKLVYFSIMKSISKEILARKDVPIFYSETEKDPFNLYCRQI